MTSKADQKYNTAVREAQQMIDVIANELRHREGRWHDAGETITINQAAADNMAAITDLLCDLNDRLFRTRP